MAMAMKFGRAMVLVVIASVMMGASLAYPGWNNNNGYAWPPKQDNGPTEVPPTKVVVGGSENWHFGFDYSTWANKNGPFYVNDTLVFKYDPPSDSNTHPHSVYMFPSFWSYMRCDLKRATMVANVSDGAGDGFEFKLSQKWKFYFFACGESGGFHCSTGKMRFSVVSLPRPWKWHG
ncbi:uncharacterized protein LOC120296034 [Eucalyptus grandis]|uniref:Phytocyanin domain-containing protein n=2 Tax=Eucalyptus TaxID=3932 RepID=A0ABD3JYS0_EUCGL|nr:uncharacterized protein LOC120296034 [Eucalyptus grandis]